MLDRRNNLILNIKILYAEKLTAAIPVSLSTETIILIFLESKNLCTTKMQNKNRKGRKVKQLGRFKDIKKKGQQRPLVGTISR